MAKTKKYTVSFKDNEIENELYEWVLKKAQIIGPAVYTKQLLLEKYLEEKESAEK